MTALRTPQRVAFLGLGVMGAPMAGHLQTGGFATTVYNRTASRAGAWQQRYGGQVAPTPAAAAKNVDVVCVCVGADADVRTVILGDDGALAAMSPGTLLIDHTTTSAELARELAAACEKRSVHFLDAPVSGGQKGAEDGRLTVMLGGEAESYAVAQPLLDCYAASTTLIGSHGSGQLAKMVNQICIAGLVQGLAEGMHFAQRAGLDIGKVIGAVSGGAAQSWQMQNRWQTMQSGDYEHGFAVDWMRKDLDYALAEARRNGSRLPVTALVDQFYAEVQAQGGGRWDTSSLLARLQVEKS